MFWFPSLFLMLVHICHSLFLSFTWKSVDYLATLILYIWQLGCSNASAFWLCPEHLTSHVGYMAIGLSPTPHLPYSGQIVFWLVYNPDKPSIGSIPHRFSPYHFTSAIGWVTVPNTSPLPVIVDKSSIGSVPHRFTYHPVSCYYPILGFLFLIIRYTFIFCPILSILQHYYRYHHYVEHCSPRLFILS